MWGSEGWRGGCDVGGGGGEGVMWRCEVWGDDVM